ncbi:MAG: 4Fe-4S dicluster domain-containing protein, partial [Candidatus Omnitrophica bacterium]|nr:4Fe-4S dicluster domain-containing protein [Candidatus Omnitrophota bacterium]
LNQWEALEKGEADTFNPAKVFAGSEGTLGILTELTLDLVPLERNTALIMIEYGEVLEALRSLPRILEHSPSAVELIDHNILGQAFNSPGLKDDVSILTGRPNAVLVVEFQDSEADELTAKVESAFKALTRDLPETKLSTLLDPADQKRVWNIRKAGLGMMMRMKGRNKPCAFIEDAAIPIESLPSYVEDLFAFLAERGLRAGAYAHASVGLLHIRPILNLYEDTGVGQLREVAEKSVELSLKYGGAFSGEHGDGFARSEFLKVTHGEQVIEAFREVKRLFDPDGLMNPGKIVDPYPMDRNLRYDGGYEGKEVETIFDYQEDGSFSNAVDLCSGVGQCRNRFVGVMCPSYMATRNEFHTTRARANALRDALNGRISTRHKNGESDWVSPEVLEALDLCLSCKACKTECPTGVDMARWKAEVLEAHAAVHGRSLSAKLIAHYPDQADLAASMAPISNWVAQSPPVRWVMEKAFGLDRRVPPPRFYRKTLRKWFREFQSSEEYRTSEADKTRSRVVFFVDTFTNINQPAVGIAAIRLLMAGGRHPIIPDNVDEGRTRFSKGFLREARELVGRNLEILE